VTAPEIAAALGHASREGRDWRCRCPVHGGHSLTVSDGRNALLVRAGQGARQMKCSPSCAGCVSKAVP
jgi:hypothetical protein